jgi:hypothetical protein
MTNNAHEDLVDEMIAAMVEKDSYEEGIRLALALLALKLEEVTPEMNQAATYEIDKARRTGFPTSQAFIFRAMLRASLLYPKE